mmetsp:Transcript_25777/g.33788  ORF Transcript_25777/g.33788 Transcript_25777/m.33788 type:complete len:543 (+) Transcript_25777:115-1743(+)
MALRSRDFLFIMTFFVATIDLFKNWEIGASTIGLVQTRKPPIDLEKVKIKVLSVWNFRLGSAEKYAETLIRFAESSFEAMWEEGVGLLDGVVADLQSELKQSQEVYEKFREELSSQQKKLRELSNLEVEISLGPGNIPLDQFRQRYDQLEKTFQGAFPKSSKKKLRKLRKSEGELTRAALKKREKRIEDSLQSFSQQSVKITGDLQRQIQQSENLYNKALEKLQDQQKKADEALQQFKDEQISQLNEIKKLGNVASVTKKQLAAQQAVIQTAIDNLKQQVVQFITPLEEAQAQLEKDLKERYEQLMASNRLYEELVARRQSQIYVDKLNDQTLRKVLECLDEGPEDQWELISDKHGVEVSRKFMETQDSRGGKYCCVKAIGQLKCSPAQIQALFDDPTRVAEYNPFFGEGRQLERLDESTTVCWASSPGIFPLKPRDFCTLVHFRTLADGSHIVINRYVEHPDAPVTRKYQRARILLSAQIISPVQESNSKCKFITVTQVDPGGFAPAWIVNQVATSGPATFFMNVEKAARKTPVVSKVSSQ